MTGRILTVLLALLLVGCGGDGGSPNHWLDGWRVELPVNAQGKQSGKAVMNWLPWKSYKPWYQVSGKTVSMKVPSTGATTSPGRAPRTELKQLTPWTSGTLKFRVSLEKVGSILTIAQARKRGGVWIFQLRAFSSGRLEVRPRKPLDPISIGTYQLGKAFDIEVSIKKGGSIVVKKNGNQVAKVKVGNWPGPLIWKFGLYGRGGAEAKFQNVKWFEAEP